MNQCPVTARAEKQLPVCCTERRPVRISGQSICGRHLLREGHIIMHTIFCLILGEFVGNVLPEERKMVMTHGEMQMHYTFRGSI